MRCRIVRSSRRDAIDCKIYSISASSHLSAIQTVFFSGSFAIHHPHPHSLLIMDLFDSHHCVVSCCVSSSSSSLRKGKKNKERKEKLLTFNGWPMMIPFCILSSCPSFSPFFWSMQCSADIDLKLFLYLPFSSTEQ